MDVNDKLSDDKYMVFYNQTSSPANEISYRGGNSSAININSHVFMLKQNGTSVLRLVLNGSDFQQERAIISVEIYMKDVWRINAIARGFNGGLVDLLRSYGGEEAVLQIRIRCLPRQWFSLRKYRLKRSLKKLLSSFLWQNP